MTNYFVHETSLIDKGALVGDDTKIWHFSHICSKAIIGKKCVLGQNVYVGNNVKIGDFVKVQNNVSVYDNVTLEDYVFCGPSMVFTNVYNPRSMIERKTEFRDTVVKRGATLGANCTIVCGVEIGEFAFVAAGAVITKSVKPYALMAGVPAIQKGWMSEYGEMLELPIEGDGEALCPNTRDKYQLKNGFVTKL